MTAKATSAPMMLEPAMVACTQEAYSPRRCGGACSISRAAAPPISPPAEKPCNTRAVSRRIGAPTPMAA